MEIYKIVKKELGNTSPVGEEHIDSKRLENLKATCYLVDKLIIDIIKASTYENRAEASMSRIGKYASIFLKSLGQSNE